MDDNTDFTETAEPVEVEVPAPKAKKAAKVATGNPKRDAARARVKELMARKKP